MTAVESPVTVTTTPSATTARCVCGRTHQIPARPGEITAYSQVMRVWAEHWHQQHESETT